MKTLLDLFLAELADLYDAEQRMTTVFEKLAKIATDSNLKAALKEHLSQTYEHIHRLDRVFAAVEAQPFSTKCHAMIGLVKESGEIASENDGEATLDAALIALVQKIEHYEIAAYGCLIEWADLLGSSTAGNLLEQNLGEEKCADELLTQLARSRSNFRALARGDDPILGRKLENKAAKDPLLA